MNQKGYHKKIRKYFNLIRNKNTYENFDNTVKVMFRGILMPLNI